MEKMKKGIVLSLCDYSGVMVKPWAEAGYQCLCVDIEPVEHAEKNITFLKADVTEWVLPNDDYAIVFAFPPCTNLAISGARWFRNKGLKGLIQGLEVVDACIERCIESKAPWMIENPVSTISTYWRKPDYSFDPCDYGDPYTKKTCLWTSDDFVMPIKNRVFPTEDSKMNNLPPSPDRGRLRSLTPKGFAEAVFKANFAHEVYGGNFNGKFYQKNLPLLSSEEIAQKNEKNEKTKK